MQTSSEVAPGFSAPMGMQEVILVNMIGQLPPEPPTDAETEQLVASRDLSTGNLKPTSVKQASGPPIVFSGAEIFAFEKQYRERTDALPNGSLREYTRRTDGTVIDVDLQKLALSQAIYTNLIDRMQRLCNPDGGGHFVKAKTQWKLNAEGRRAGVQMINLNPDGIPPDCQFLVGAHGKQLIKRFLEAREYYTSVRPTPDVLEGRLATIDDMLERPATAPAGTDPAEPKVDVPETKVEKEKPAAPVLKDYGALTLFLKNNKDKIQAMSLEKADEFIVSPMIAIWLKETLKLPDIDVNDRPKFIEALRRQAAKIEQFKLPDGTPFDPGKRAKDVIHNALFDQALNYIDGATDHRDALQEIADKVKSGITIDRGTPKSDESYADSVRTLNLENPELSIRQILSRRVQKGHPAASGEELKPAAFQRFLNTELIELKAEMNNLVTDVLKRDRAIDALTEAINDYKVDDKRTPNTFALDLKDDRLKTPSELAYDLAKPGITAEKAEKLVKAFIGAKAEKELESKGILKTDTPANRAELVRILNREVAAAQGALNAPFAALAAPATPPTPIPAAIKDTGLKSM